MATLAELEAALKKAHAAGNAEHARAFANAIRQMRATQTDNGVRMSPQEWADTENLPIPGTEWNTPEQPARFKSPIPGGDFMNEAARSFAENVPIFGPLVDRGAQAAGSQLASMIPGVNMSPEELQAQRDVLRAKDASEQPVANAAGTVAGTVGPLMSVGTTKLGQQALGMAGPLWQRIMAGGLSGGLISAGDTAARGGSWEDIGNAGKLGLGLGAAFPLAERGLSAVARALMASDADRAASTLATGLERDRIDPRMVGDMVKQGGPDAMLIDAGPNVSRQGSAIASLPGQGQTMIRDALVQRNMGQSARIRQDVDAIFGPSTSPRAFNQNVTAAQKLISPEYERAFANASPVDVASLAGRLDSLGTTAVGEISGALSKVRGMLNDRTVNVPKSFTGALGVQAPLIDDPRQLFAIRQELDDMIGGAQGNLKRVLVDVRQEVDGLLAGAVPGIKEADQKFASLARQRDAFETGQMSMDSGRAALTPSDLADITSTAGDDIIGAMTAGARAEIDRIIGTRGYDLNSLKTALKGDGSWNRERLTTLFGQEKADKLINVLERESTYQRTYNTVMSNSETAARLAAQKDVAPRQFGERPTSITDLLMRVPQGIANTAARSRSEAVNKMIVEALMSQPTPELVDRLIAARAANTGKLGAAPVPLLVNQ